MIDITQPMGLGGPKKPKRPFWKYFVPPVAASLAVALIFGAVTLLFHNGKPDPLLSQIPSIAGMQPCNDAVRYKILALKIWTNEVDPLFCGTDDSKCTLDQRVQAVQRAKLLQTWIDTIQNSCIRDDFTTWNQAGIANLENFRPSPDDLLRDPNAPDLDDGDGTQTPVLAPPALQPIQP